MMQLLMLYYGHISQQQTTSPTVKYGICILIIPVEHPLMNSLL